MPQISPMNWILTCLMFILLLMMMTGMKPIYLKTYKTPKTKKLNKTLKW